MPHIQQIPPHVAELIAAGEVVERPASVVKELVENAIDAGATAVAVELRRGGMGLIRVSDDGCGIAPEELPTAFLRHATSKLRQPEDLGKIGTLGFRGEALAAIAAVSHVEILTRLRGADSAASLRLTGGTPGAVEAAGAPEGTTISVSDLFYNTPARLKFMKKDSAETAAVAGLMQHLALSRPDISFRFTKDGTESLHTPGDGKLDSAVYAALGRDFARTLLAVDGRGGDTAVRGFVTRPESGRGSRSMQTFFVNGRFIKSQLLTAAVEEAYRNQLMKGKFPGCVLFVTVPVTEVDVNVHPAKTVVKFSREKEVFDAVYHTVLDTLDGQGAAAASRESAAASSPSLSTAPRRDFYQRLDAGTFRSQGGTSRSQAGSGGERSQSADHRGESQDRVPYAAQELTPYRVDPPRPSPAAARDLSRAPGDGFSRTSSPLPQKPEARPEPENRRPFVPAIPAENTFRRRLEAPLIQAEPDHAPERDHDPERDHIPSPAEMEEPALESPGESPWRIAGEVFRTYIVCESGEGCLWLIDKHAAHERINFDRLKAGETPVMRQVLLTPAAVEMEREDGALLLENLPLLERFGFVCEDFGGNTVLVREVPSNMDAGDVPSALEEFAENLRRGRSLDEKRESILRTIACKASIKGGWDSDPAELRTLVEKVQSGQVRFCPHGRPVAVKVTKHELEKLFGRA